MRLTPIFNVGDIVRMPFPYVEREWREVRPGLIVSSALGPRHDLHWALMITSAANRGWPGDVEIRDHHSCGLPSASVIRTRKVAVVQASQAERVGALDAETLDLVKSELRGLMGL